jgi:hypothetical protein
MGAMSASRTDRRDRNPEVHLLPLTTSFNTVAA